MNSKGLEEGKKRLAAFFIEGSIDGRESVTCRHLLESQLPQFVKESIVSLARRHLKLEKPVLWNFRANIDFDDDEVKFAGEKLMYALLKNVRFQRHEVEACIFNAVKVRIDLLLRPKQTIEKLIFKENKTIDKNIVIRTLTRLGKDIPFIETLEQEIKEFEKQELSRDIFQQFSENVYDKIYRNGNVDSIYVEFELLSELLNHDKTLTKSYLETEFVEEFFHSRGLEEALRTVRKKRTQGKKQWLREDIEDIFTFILKKPEAKAEEEADFSLPRIIFKDDSGFIIQRQKIESQPPGPYPSIFDFIDRKDWKVFVRKIFKKNEIDFKEFLYKVDGVSKWRDAKQIIDWELEKRRLDPYSKEAVRLGDIVFAKFFSNGKYS